MSDLSIRSCRSSLFWSALRLKDLDQLKQIDTDIICIDLEDAVPPSDKARGLHRYRVVFQLRKL